MLTLAWTRITPALLMIVLAAGCGESDSRGADEPEAAESDAAATSGSTSTPASEPPDSCQTLDAALVEELAGAPLGAGRTTQIGGLLPGCLWGSLGDVGVQAAVVSAELWARSLPEVVAQLKASVALDEANLQKLEDAAALVESGTTIPAEQACSLFSDLVELNGMPAGSDSTVNLVPSREDPQGITGQMCRDGVFGTIVLVRPDLTGSDEEIREVEDALESLPTAV